jgi:hypothetical protein
MNRQLRPPVAVVAHDAGAASHMVAWLKEQDHRRLSTCLAGPALSLWRRQYGEPLVTYLIDALNGASTLFSGTSWASDLEHEARRLARQRGIHSISVIDHWVNYRERFIRNGEEVLPDQIWVSDSYAKELAEAVFPCTEVIEQPNVYLANLVEEVERIQQAGVLRHRNRVLYVLEPIRGHWGTLNALGEFLALDYFIDNLAQLALTGDVQIRLRPHPSDPPGKYDPWIARQRDPRITLDVENSLTEALAWSNVVAGCQTYAMVVALSTGRTVYSSIPPWAPPCCLPHQAIVKVASLPQLSAIGGTW